MNAENRMLVRSWVCGILIVSGLGLATPRYVISAPTLQTTAAPEVNEHDGEFDFWLGDWEVQNRHLQSSGEWQPGGIAIAKIRSCLGGRAVIEQWNGQGNLGLRGYSFRNYDPEQERWEIILNWHRGAPSGFSMMVGNFAEGRGEFFPPNGPPRIRFTFSKAQPESCQWDQAKSTDGKQWKTDWIMSFSRKGPAKSLDATNLPIEYPSESIMDKFPETRQLDQLIGVWKGTAQRTLPDGSVQQGTAIRRVTSMIDGFGLLQITKFSWGEESVAAISFNPRQRKWYEVGMSTSEPDCHWMSGTKTAGRLRLDETSQSDHGRNHIWKDLTDDSFKWIQESHVGKTENRRNPEIEVEFRRDE